MSSRSWVRCTAPTSARPRTSSSMANGPVRACPASNNKKHLCSPPLQFAWLLFSLLVPLFIVLNSPLTWLLLLFCLFIFSFRFPLPAPSTQSSLVPLMALGWSMPSSLPPRASMSSSSAGRRANLMPSRPRSVCVPNPKAGDAVLGKQNKVPSAPHEPTAPTSPPPQSFVSRFRFYSFEFFPFLMCRESVERGGGAHNCRRYDRRAVHAVPAHCGPDQGPGHWCSQCVSSCVMWFAVCACVPLCLCLIG